MMDKYQALLKQITLVGKNCRWLCGLLMLTFLAACSGDKDPILSPDSVEGLISIAVSPANSSLAEGESQQFSAVGVYANGTSLDITNRVSWVSSATEIAGIDSSATVAPGLVTGLSIGTARISASLAGISAETMLTVTASLSRILVTPANSGVIVGQARQFTATGAYSDGSSANITALVTWTSSDNAIALPDADTTSRNGLIGGVSPGVVQIAASMAGIAAETRLTVTAPTLASISVTPVNTAIAVGSSRQFIATGIYSDGSTATISNSVVWASADTAVATLNASGAANSGLASGQAAGVAQISATLNNISAAASLTVTNASLTSINVTPANPSVVTGLARQFSATGSYSDGSTADLTLLADWTSADTAVASMSPNQQANSGLATGVLAGTSLIQASYSGVADSTTLTVNSATLTSIAVTPASASAQVDDAVQFTATGTYSDGSSENISTTVIWTSADTAVAVMNASAQSDSGQATAIATGTADIRASLGSEQGSAVLTVNPALADNPQAPAMGELQRFITIASQATTTTAGSTLANGDMAILDLARTAYAGFTPGPVAGEFTELTNGISFAPDDATPPYVIPAPYASMVAFINQVRTDLGNAATFLAADPNPAVASQALPAELGGLVLTRGVYRNAGNVIVEQGDLTLDAQGDPDSVFIFVIGGTFTTGAPGGNLILTGGAKANNVYWRTGGATVFGSNTRFAGNVFAWPQINLGTGADITGRLFSVTEQVTLDANMVTKP